MRWAGPLVTSPSSGSLYCFGGVHNCFGYSIQLVNIRVLPRKHGAVRLKLARKKHFELFCVTKNYQLAVILAKCNVNDFSNSNVFQDGRPYCG